MDTDIWIYSCLWEHVFQNLEGTCSFYKQKTTEEGEDMNMKIIRILELINKLKKRKKK